MSKNIEGAQPFPFEDLPAIPSTAAKTLQAMAPETFSLLDFLALPLPTSEPVTQTFEARGRFWSVTVKTDALDDPEQFFALSALMSDGRKTKAVKISVDATAPFTITSGQYIGALSLLAKVCVSPSLGFDEWAEFGRRVGGKTIVAIINFALTANGFSDEAIKEEEATAGESTGTAA